MRIVARVVALGGVLVAVARPAEAQYPPRREGFWIGFGLGYGSANITCDSCDSGPRTGGVTASLKLGRSPSLKIPTCCASAGPPAPATGWGGCAGSCHSAGVVHVGCSYASTTVTQHVT